MCTIWFANGRVPIKALCNVEIVTHRYSISPIYFRWGFKKKAGLFFHLKNSLAFWFNNLQIGWWIGPRCCLFSPPTFAFSPLLIIFCSFNYRTNFTNFTYILWAAFVLISFWQKITNTNCKQIKALSHTFVWKTCS